jgi:hypothetical protein
MIKRNSFYSKYVNVPTININSWRKSCTRAIFSWRSDIEQNKVCDIPSRNIDDDDDDDNNNNNNNNNIVIQLFV